MTVGHGRCEAAPGALAAPRVAGASASLHRRFAAAFQHQASLTALLRHRRPVPASWACLVKDKFEFNSAMLLRSPWQACFCPLARSDATAYRRRAKHCARKLTCNARPATTLPEHAHLASPHFPASQPPCARPGQRGSSGRPFLPPCHVRHTQRQAWPRTCHHGSGQGSGERRLASLLRQPSGRGGADEDAAAQGHVQPHDGPAEGRHQEGHRLHDHGH